MSGEEEKWHFTGERSTFYIENVLLSSSGNSGFVDLALTAIGSGPS